MIPKSKKKQEIRNAFIIVRVTPQEKEMLQEKAGRNLSLLVRRLLKLKD